MIQYILTEKQSLRALLRACERNKTNMRDHRRSDKSSPADSDPGIHLTGSISEEGFSAISGIPLSCELHNGSQFRRGTNVPDCGEWEIKGTRWANGKLMIQAHQKHKHHDHWKYVLLAVDRVNIATDEGYREADRVTVRGWAFGHEFIRDENIDRSRPVAAYVAPALREFTMADVGR